jgi:integrase/recombinase XerD
MISIMSVNLPAPVPASSELVRARFAAVAAARRAEQDALHDDTDPWTRADTQADLWLRSARFLPGTRDQYRMIWAAWRAWCTIIDVPPLDTQRSDVDAYATALERVGNPAVAKPTPLSRRSVARHLAALSSYYARAIDDGRTDRNPVPARDRPKVSRKSRQPHLTVDEIRALIAAADADGPRTAALVVLLLLACLRVTEALASRVEDLSYESGTHMLWVRRKGDNSENVPVPPQLYQRLVPVIGARKEGPILATASGAAIDRKAAWETVRRVGRRAGIAAAIGPHTLRHAYITRGHEMGIPVDRLQDAAGHSSVDTTRGYDRSRLDPSRHPSFAIAEDLLPATRRRPG